MIHNVRLVKQLNVTWRRKYSATQKSRNFLMLLTIVLHTRQDVIKPLREDKIQCVCVLSIWGVCDGSLKTARCQKVFPAWTESASVSTQPPNKDVYSSLQCVCCCRGRKLFLSVRVWQLKSILSTHPCFWGRLSSIFLFLRRGICISSACP